MRHIAIIVSSQYGQTRKIADFIAAEVEAQGFKTTVFQIDGEHPLKFLLPFWYDAVCLGSPVYAGKFSKELIEWTAANRDQLNLGPTAFFSVSLNAADKREKAQVEGRRLISEFVAETGLKPLITASLIGTVHYTKYGILKRWLLKRICASAGGPTDTSRDHELTDWGAVKEFAASLVNVASSRPQMRATTGQPG